MVKNYESDLHLEVVFLIWSILTLIDIRIILSLPKVG